MVDIINLLVSAIPENFMILFEIGMMIVIAGIMAFIFKLFKQPRIPAYVIAGIILGPLVLGLIESSEVILSLSEIGIAFLLFFAGLEINFKNLKQVGKVATITGLLEMILIGLIAIGLFVSFELQNIEMIYIMLIAAFSSTMVAIKILSDKNELGTLHGRIIVGILLVQDIIAIIALTVLNGDLTPVNIGMSLAKAIGFAVVAGIFAKISEPILKISAKSTELILIVSLSFLFLFSIAAYVLGLSVVVGSFFTGVALANSQFKTEIKGRIHSLRDFFGAILFVSLGMQLVWIAKEYLVILGLLLLLIIFIKPILIMIIVRLTGYTERTSFLTGNLLGQSSEFGLILMTQAIILGQISQEFFSMTVFAVIVSMTLTGYFSQYESSLYRLVLRPAKIFRKVPIRYGNLKYGLANKKKVILLGCHRTGSLILKNFNNMKKDILVIDFDPEIIKSLIKKKVSCIYGDFNNPEIVEKIIFTNPELIISTIPSKEDNIDMIKKAKKLNLNVNIIVVAERISDAIELYEKGADYVILPKVLSGEKIIEILNNGKNKEKITKKKELQFLKDIHYFLYKRK